MPNRPHIQIATLPELHSAVVRTLLYFDIFSYPLTAKEIHRALSLADVTEKDVDESLGQMVEQGLIAKQEDFYLIEDEREKVERRKKGNAEAARRIPKALKVSRFIGKFPYVRAVMLSGSLSKNYMEADSDIDYFVVTKPGRLWICRTLLILYKKVFLLNSHRNFCVNYFVDSDHLEIEDKNLFTATEVSFLLPSYNYKLYRHFREANQWAEAYYPNFGLREDHPCPEENRSFFRRSMEWILNSRLGERLDNWCMNRTLGRWKQKFSDLDQAEFEIALRTRKCVSKHHPRQFQELVTRKLAENQASFEEKFQLKLSNP